VRAEDLRFVRKRCQLVERIRHLFRRTLEQPAAAAGKEGVAAEKPAVFSVVIGDMTARMAGNIDHLQRQAKRRNLYAVALGKRNGYLRNAVRTWTEDGDREIFQQCGYAPDMVSMVMCQ